MINSIQVLVHGPSVRASVTFHPDELHSAHFSRAPDRTKCSVRSEPIRQTVSRAVTGEVLSVTTEANAIARCPILTMRAITPLQLIRLSLIPEPRAFILLLEPVALSRLCSTMARMGPDVGVLGGHRLLTCWRTCRHG